jgi:deoxyribonuclease IV
VVVIILAHFGSAGNPAEFYAGGHKSSLDMPAWLAAQGLSAYEYQCSRGVHIGEATARALGAKASEYGVQMSVHAPYYINLATGDETVAGNTKRHFRSSLMAAQWMGADRVVFHIGGPGKQDRQVAMEQARRLFAEILEQREQQGLAGVWLAPETMGKQNQLGTLPEVLSLCQMSQGVIPTVDFGHLHAVSGGGFTTRAEYEGVFAAVTDALGSHMAQKLHIHFSRIEFTKGGEKRHWSFGDPFGPPHEPLLETMAIHGYQPRVICESAGTQARDARIMQDFYLSLLNQ